MKKLFQNQVLSISIALCLVFLTFALAFGKDLNAFLNQLAIHSLALFGKFYLYLGLIAFLVILIIAFSPKGKLRLGNGMPEYSRFSWIAMLYSTGMGTGLMLRAVQEPVYYFQNPPNAGLGTHNSIYALKYTFFHWGFTPWAFYALFGLFIAYFLYVKKTSILSSSFLEGRFRKAWLITLVDLLTVLSTLIGAIASLGLGSRQLLGGFNYIKGEEYGLGLTLSIVLVIAIISTASAFLGIRNSIRRLSNFNIGLALALLFFVFFNGESIHILQELGLASVEYVRDFIPMSLNLGSSKVSNQFLSDWTYFYWAFWLAWAPFTGIFIARISRGRTIREFALGTLFIPSIATFLWFSTFGNSAFSNIEALPEYLGKYDSIYQSIFIFMSELPFSTITTIGSFILILTFLITSVDSAILVLSYYSQKNQTESKKQRLVWGILIPLVTMSLIIIGQEELLKATSNMLVLIGLPFSLLFTVMIANFLIKLFASKKRL